MITDGVLVINKPQNWTSHDCVAVCRKALGIKRIGHGGTLDPMAEGVLPIFIGRATRIMQYMDMDYKSYECRVKLGISTETQDIWGEVISIRDTEKISKIDILRAAESFKGYIEQKPPKYSALKVKGKKLYEYARSGIEVEIKPRKVYIKEMVTENIDMEKMELSFKVTCSKGTYIRAICNDLGEMLGCGAAMSYLKRTGSGVFNLDNSLTPDDVKNMKAEDMENYIFPVDYPLIHFSRAELKRDRAVYFASGNSIRWSQVNAGINTETEDKKKYKVYQAENGKFLGIGYYNREKDELKADKIFVTRQEI